MMWKNYSNFLLSYLLLKNKKHLIVIAGPTAIGKTALAISLAKHFNTEIISADSRQFFKEMTIGTAKPSQCELQEIKHHFINSHSVLEEYNVGKFEHESIFLLDNLFKTNDIVILVGGSGLYMDAVCEGFDDLPEADSEVRKKIDTLLATEGIEALQTLLKDLDSVYYSQVDINNPQRMSRALEVCLTTGKTYSGLREGKSKERNFTSIKIGLNTSREILYNRINERVDEMMLNGLLAEVESLIKFKHLNALQTVGYKELFEYLDGTIDKQTSINQIKQNTRKFAKRQLTWFKRDREMKWFEPDELENIMNYIVMRRGKMSK